MSQTFEQRRFGTRYTFNFHRDEVAWEYRGRDGSAQQRVPYYGLPLEPCLQIEQSCMLRRLAWLAFLFAAIDLARAASHGSGSNLSTFGYASWLVIGLACLGLRRLLRLRYSVFSSSNGGAVFVLRDDPNHDRIVEQLLAHRKEARLEHVRLVDGTLPLESDRKRLQRLHEQGLLEESELRQLEGAARRADRSPDAVATARARCDRAGTDPAARLCQRQTGPRPRAASEASTAQRRREPASPASPSPRNLGQRL